MPSQHTIDLAHRDQRAGKSACTQAGEFVREEFELIRKSARGARSTKRAIAIGLSKARRDLDKARQGGNQPASREPSRAALDALKRERRKPDSKTTRTASPCRSMPTELSASAKKAARTPALRSH